MEAQVKRIQWEPATYDNEGDVKAPEHAKILLVIPTDHAEAFNAVVELQRMLRHEWLDVQIQPKQKVIPDTTGSTTKTATLTGKQAETQLEAAS